MATIHVDGKEYDVDGADNLLQACLSLGLDIPYFCWHPALGSVGACRQCAVKQFQNAEDTRGRLVMSCMTPASDGTFISIDDGEAKEFRESVVEWLMTNHPHDCPVCEEGGNCHLQDMTVMTGHSFRRYRFTKRTHRNQDLGPFISHEMNRCIACYRCVRYYKDYADGTDLGVYGAHDNVYFGRPEDGVLESEFSGNLVEICPTGVFTDKTHSERYNRKWDMQFAPSICQQCSIGCNTSPGERYGELRRIENRYNGTVNHYFLCDRGRFGYGYVNLKDRPRQPMQRRGDDWISLNADQAMQGAADVLRQAKKVIGIGSPRASVESNFALRELVGADNFSTGIPAGEQGRLDLMLKVLRDGGIHTPALREIESYDAVLVLGED
ncbi:MAG TPA: NADH dehydrogenase (quinone) subunit G, partial [Erwinia persicina]|nr:NADH dehydrogenase (quinone) subunit G [Erwinia persicina]